MDSHSLPSTMAFHAGEAIPLASQYFAQLLACLNAAEPQSKTDPFGGRNINIGK